MQEVPREEIQINDERYDNEDLVYIPVFHYQRDLQRTHSVPFQLLLIKVYYSFLLFAAVSNILTYL